MSTNRQYTTTYCQLPHLDRHVCVFEFSINDEIWSQSIFVCAPKKKLFTLCMHSAGHLVYA